MGQMAAQSALQEGSDPLGVSQTQQGAGGSARAHLPNVQQNTGDLVYEYPISIPPGRNGLQPDLKIAYDSQSPSEGSVYGSNWSDNVPYIVRFNKAGVDKLYSTTTSQYFSSSLDRELATTTDATKFVARTDDGSFRTYTFTSSTNQWLMRDKSGTQYKFGYSTSSRQDDPNDASHAYKWMLEEVRDTNDNYIKYTYSKDSGQIYPSSIVYTGSGSTDGIFEIDFATGARSDVSTSTRSGFAVVTKSLIERIDVKISGSLVRQYTLGYTAGDNGTRLLLSTAVESGRDESGSTVTVPTTTFSYQSQIPGWSSSSTWYPPGLLTSNTFQDLGYRIVDVNGDGLPDMIRSYNAGSNYYEAWINNGHGWTSDPDWYPPVLLTTNMFQDLGYRIVDVNGDGLVDIIRGYNNGGSDVYEAYINNGNGWTSDSTWIPPGIFATTSFQDTGYRIVDVNGDGLPDMIRSYNAGSDYYEAWINNGHGWTSDSTWYPPVLLMSNTFKDIGFRVVDVNGDGLPDIIHSYDDGTGNYTYSAYINNGHGWTSDANWYPPVRFSVYPGKNAGFFITDVDGDGLPDMMRSYNAGSNYYEAYANNGTVQSLLKKITYPQGGSTSFTYKPASQYTDQNGDMVNKAHSIIQTVSSITTDDAFGNVATTTYQYSGGKMYFNGGSDTRFAGFASTVATDPQGNVTKTYFHQGDGTDTSHGQYSDNYFKIGKPYRVEKYDANGNLFEKVINKWDSSSIANSGAGFVKLAQTVDHTYDGDSSHKDRAETYVYDGATGNQTQKIEYGQVTGSDDGTFSDTGSDLLTTDLSYASSASSSVVGAVKQITVTDQNSVQVKDVKYYYDGLSFGSIDKGNQTKEEDWKTGTSYVNSQKSYNGYGLVATSTDPRGKVTTYSYDSYNLYPTSVTDPLSYSTQYLYDYSLGKPKKVTDPNGLITQTTYDGLDRMIQTEVPDLTTSSTLDIIESITYTDTSGAVSVKDSKQVTSTSTADSYSYYDGLGRLIQSRTAGISSAFETKDLSYDSRGLLAKESLPYFSAGTARTTATSTSALFTNYTYDALQRTRTASNILGNATTTYSDWKTTITDPNGKTKDLVYDAYKRLVEVDEHVGSSTYSTFYQYDGNGDLTKITDASGNVRNFTYDALGRRLTAEDLHATGDGTFGSWSYTYDDGGNLTAQVDPKNQTINYTYDDVNRPLTEDYTGQSGTEVTYTYDSCSYGIGSLCTASSTAIRIVDTYNPRRSLASETRTIDGTDYTTSYTYDLQGNQLTMTNPDSSQIKYEYSGGHFLNKVSKKESTDSGFISVVDSFDYAPNGQVSSVTFANGVTQANTYDPAKLYRLTNKVSTLPNASKAQDISYTYDAVGNITQLVEAGATSTRRTVSYGYDDLYRLTSASATGTSSGISGYNQTFSYDALGNLLSSDQGDYAYAGNTGSSYANPDAATTVGSFGLTYDNNGNLIGTTSSTSGWTVNGGTWSQRRVITIDHTKVSGTSALVDFPMLIATTDAGLNTVANGGYVASSTGADIFFTSSDGSTKLSHEIESYVSSTGALTAWVKIPSLSTSADTLLYMYYGNASSSDQQSKTATWDSSTKGVWHFNDSLADSSSNANNGTNNGSLNLSTGKIGGARDFTNAWGTVRVPSSPSLQPSTQLTLSFWINQYGAQPDWVRPILYGQDSVNPWGAYGFYIDPSSDNNLNFVLGSTNNNYGLGVATLATSTWQYIVGTFDGTTMKLYLDGNQISTRNDSFSIGDYDGTTGLSMGSSWSNWADWTGYLDEIRVASTTRSADWIKTEYNNQNSPATFYALGATSGGSWYSTGGTWNYRKPMTVDHSKVSTVNQTTLTNFPLLVSVTDDNLKTTGNGGKVGKADGTDILFTSSDGVTKLDHEIESYSSTTGALVAWVRVPTLIPSADTNLYLYLGNASASDQQNKTGTWDSSMKGVWHFNNSLSDSTANANNGTNNGTTNLTVGRIGSARDFTGAWDTVTVPSTPSLQPSTQLTLSLWIDQSGSQPDWVRPIQYGQDSANPWGAYNFYIDANSDTALNFALGSTNTSYGLGTAQLTTSTWQYIVGTFDGSAMKLYQDGDLISTRNDLFSIGDYNGTAGLSMGSSWSNWSNWSGYLDETRVASTTRSADWIRTEYNNQSTSTMLGLGSLQASTTSITVDSPSSTQSTITWDYLNRLTQYMGLTSTSTYAYDPSNERIKSSVTTGTSTQTTYYPTKSYNITDGTPIKHVFANGLMVATITGTGASSTVSYILTDHLTGSNVVTNASGTIVELSDYYPFGATRIDDQSGFNEQRKFAGHEFDSSTGLSYMGARYYNGNYGRFISQDPAFQAVGDRQKLKDATNLKLQQYLSNPQALNAYSYSFNNPLIYRDESGQFAFLIPVAVYLAETAPVWVPAAITGVAAVGAAVSTHFVSSAAGSYVAGDQEAGDRSINNAMTTFGVVAGGVEGLMMARGQLASYAANASKAKVTPELQKTIDRIKSGGSNPHPNDGIVFKNREGLLPQRSQGYYREYVHPTPGVSGAGSQRVVVGSNGEIYYSQDHYKTFVKLGTSLK